MDKFDKFSSIIKKYNPDYRFSWQISTEIIEDQLNPEVYWLNVGARDNNRMKYHPQAALGLGLDIESKGEIYTDSNNFFCLGSAYDIPAKDNVFDFVASRFLFEHLEKPISAFSEIARVLKPGGIFLLETTNKNNPLLLIARLIPFSIKKFIIKRLFKDNPSGTYKTYYRLNTPSVYRSLDLSSVNLELDELHIVNDVICESRLLFTITFQLYKLITFLGLRSLYGNILAVFKKVR